MNKAIKKEAERLKLKVTEYHGFVRRKVWDGEMYHCGAWDFQTMPIGEIDEEPMSVFAYNIVDALRQMQENATYFYGERA